MITVHEDDMHDIKAYSGSRVVAVAWAASGMIDVWHCYDIVAGGGCRAETFSRLDTIAALQRIAAPHDQPDLLGEAA
jgi:hypothetical protein